MFTELFGTKTPVLGMVHLPALGGAPGWSKKSGLDALDKQVFSEVSVLQFGGVSGILFENFGDAPFTKGKVGALTVSMMTRVLSHCSSRLTVPFGVNVLRNDWEAALGIAGATGAAFIRVNVLSGVYATDQGVIEGEAYSCLRLRKKIEDELGSKILIFADVQTKHGTPLMNQSLTEATKDLAERAGADAVIVTGSRTGIAPGVSEVEQVINAAGEVPVLIGSGITAENLKKYSRLAQNKNCDLGFIVGTYLKENGKVDKPIDPERMKKLMKALK